MLQVVVGPARTRTLHDVVCVTSCVSGHGQCTHLPLDRAGEIRRAVIDSAYRMSYVLMPLTAPIAKAAYMTIGRGTGTMSIEFTLVSMALGNRA